MATDINVVTIVGRLVRDIDEKSFGYTNSGTARANLSIAVNRSIKKNNEWQNEVSYFDVSIWGKMAENLKPYLQKGKQICVTGCLKQERWEKNGEKFSKVCIVADSVQLLGGNGEKSESKPASQKAPASDEFPEDIPFDNAPEGIPF